MPRRRKDRVDANQGEIIKALKRMGCTVQDDMDDILVGYRGRNYWFELKNPDVANKDGKVFESEKKNSQKLLEKTWRGHYRIVTTLAEIIDDLKAEG